MSEDNKIEQKKEGFLPYDLVIYFFTETYTLKGRMGVLRFWIFFIIHLIIYFVIYFTLLSFGIDILISLGIAAFYLYLSYGCLKCKRLHDLDRSGWWTLPVLIIEWVPLIGLIPAFYTSFAKGKKGQNRFGEIEPMPGLANK